MVGLAVIAQPVAALTIVRPASFRHRGIQRVTASWRAASEVIAARELADSK